MYYAYKLLISLLTESLDRELPGIGSSPFGQGLAEGGSDDPFPPLLGRPGLNRLGRGILIMASQSQCGCQVTPAVIKSTTVC